MLCGFPCCNILLNSVCDSSCYVAGVCVVARPAPHAGVGPPASLAVAGVQPVGDFVMCKLVPLALLPSTLSVGVLVFSVDCFFLFVAGMLLGPTDAALVLRNQAIGVAAPGTRVPQWLVGRFGEGEGRNFYPATDFDMSGIGDEEWGRFQQHGLLAGRRYIGRPGKCWCRCFSLLDSVIY